MSRRSALVWSAPAVLAATFLGGCVVVDDRHHGMADQPSYVDESGGALECAARPIAAAAIDADEPVVVTLGDGAGVFVEYARGGHWHVYTTCDTNRPPHGSCLFDVYLRSADGASLLGVVGDRLEPSDSLASVGADGVELTSYVGADADGAWVDAAPGASLRIATWVGSACDGHYTYWNGDGAVRVGAPTNPIELRPSAP